MAYNYSAEGGEKSAKAVGLALPISPKHSIEICNMIRGRSAVRAKKMLEDVIDEKKAVPFKRFTAGVGHRKGGISSGRFPKKACFEILKLIKSAEANAQFKGISTADLVVKHICAQRAGKAMHYGRRRGIQQKRTTIELFLEEIKQKSEAKKESKKGAKAANAEKPKEKAKGAAKE